MKQLCLIAILLLGGCASYEPDRYGNYNDVVLTPTEMHAISQDIAVFLRQSEGASRIVNINHDGSNFANTLIETLRRQGLGVAQDNARDYLSLNYRVKQLNPTQFVVTAVLSDGRKLSRIWVVSNNHLIPLKTRAYGVEYD
ncbi:TPA: hypothetical protein ACN976_000765 [Vibrio campbellii]